ncbi:MAG: tRNA (adenosine(37)-N6)-threonylcarbamoyltransferase complex ATPase subunit type 1 TsaE [Verrucomicrobiia bacterium]|jgi:tRNA threonylcarbamoyladenosine biosynthesis protein TsaE
MAIFISHSEEETIQLGIQWAKETSKGTIFGLIGELGSGKTQLVKGLAKGLGINQTITSPTFAIVNEYKILNGIFVHIDLYRLEGINDIYKTGITEYLNKNNIVAIEWAEKLFGVTSKNSDLPAILTGLKYRQTIITAVNNFHRKIEYEDFGY